MTSSCVRWSDGPSWPSGSNGPEIHGLRQRASFNAGCGPTTHRAAQKVFFPPPHHPHECRPEPTHAALNGRGSRMHRALEASPVSRGRPRLSGSAAHLSQPICKVFRVPIGTDSRTQSAEGGEQASAQAPSPAITSAINLRDALSVPSDKNRAMRCR